MYQMHYALFYETVFHQCHSQFNLCAALSVQASISSSVHEQYKIAHKITIADGPIMHGLINQLEHAAAADFPRVADDVECDTFC